MLEKKSIRIQEENIAETILFKQVTRLSPLKKEISNII